MSLTASNVKHAVYTVDEVSGEETREIATSDFTWIVDTDQGDKVTYREEAYKLPLEQLSRMSVRLSRPNGNTRKNNIVVCSITKPLVSKDETTGIITEGVARINAELSVTPGFTLDGNLNVFSLLQQTLENPAVTLAFTELNGSDLA